MRFETYEGTYVRLKIPLKEKFFFVKDILGYNVEFL